MQRPLPRPGSKRGIAGVQCDMRTRGAGAAKTAPGRRWTQNSGFQRSMAGLGDLGVTGSLKDTLRQSPATHRICVPCQTGEMDVASNVGATPGPGACCPTTPPTFLGMIARIFWVQAMVAVVFGNLLSALASPTAELLSDGIPSAEIELLPACRISGNHQQRVPSIDGRLRPNNRAKLGLDRPASERRGPHRGRPLSSVTVRGAPRKTPTDGDLRLIFSSGRRFARIASPDGRCRREPSRELPLRYESSSGSMGGFCSWKAQGWIWKELNFSSPRHSTPGTQKEKERR